MIVTVNCVGLGHSRAVCEHDVPGLESSGAFSAPLSLSLLFTVPSDLLFNKRHTCRQKAKKTHTHKSHEVCR